MTGNSALPLRWAGWRRHLQCSVCDLAKREVLAGVHQPNPFPASLTADIKKTMSASPACLVPIQSGMPEIC
jgi:hypothetical protein